MMWYWTRPRRVSSMATTVALRAMVGRKERWPLWSWRARLAETMMKR